MAGMSEFWGAGRPRGPNILDPTATLVAGQLGHRHNYSTYYVSFDNDIVIDVLTLVCCEVCVQCCCEGSDIER